MKHLFLITIAAFFLINPLFAQKNLLVSTYSKEQLKNSLIVDDSWITFPDYYDRGAWKKIPEYLRNGYIQKGEKFLNYNWPVIPATSFLEFKRTGDRGIMEKPAFERQHAIESLVMAELMEGEGRFIDDIINGVFSYCEMTYWGWSAHLYLQKAGIGLPDVDEPIIDLGVGEVASDLAWTYHFLNKEFDKVDPLLSKRLKMEITKKVLKPYYERDDFWWMGLNTERKRVNNWDPWCNYNVLNCILLIEDNPDLKVKNVYKSMQSVDQFINVYKDDGGCDEGPSYWGHAGGKMFDYLELLLKATNNKVDVYNDELIKNMGRYIYRAYISGEYFINFADASAKIHTRADVIYRYGKRINDPIMSGFGAFLAKSYDFGKEPITGNLGLALEDLFNLDEIQNAEPKEPLIADFYLPGTQIVGVRDEGGSNRGFYFAAKGGHNDESHNHNDVGTFILYYNGKPALIDVGVGTYTKKTFSDERYDIWTMQSCYHNLPTINGIDQKEGEEFAAKNPEFLSSKTKTSFSLDIAGAYPQDANVKQWERTYTLQWGKKFQINDNYELSKISGDTRLNFMTSLEVSLIKEGILKLSGNDFNLYIKYNQKQSTPRIELIQIDDSRLMKVWSEKISRIVFEVSNNDLKGNINLEILDSWKE